MDRLRVVPGKAFWRALHAGQARLRCRSLWALDEALRSLSVGTGVGTTTRVTVRLYSLI